MPNSTSAEPKAGAAQCSSVCELTDDDPSLKQHLHSSGSLPHPHLRIVHSADRLQLDPPSVNMPPPDHPRQASGRPADRGPGRKPAMLDRAVQAQIGSMLREHFAGVAGEPVPERFIALLAELEAKETSGE